MDIEFHKVCRVCISYDELSETNNIFERKVSECNRSIMYSDNLFTECEDLHLYRVLEDLSRSEFSINDGFPQNICLNCESSVVDAHFLKLQLEKSMKTLLAIVNCQEEYIDEQEQEKSCSNSKPEKQEDSITFVPAGNADCFNIILQNETYEQVGHEQEEEETREEDYVEEIDEKLEHSLPERNADQSEDAVSFILNKTRQVAQDHAKTKRVVRSSDSQKKHVCTVCSKKFLRKSNLIDHLRLHANLRPFQCEHCDKTFVQAGNLKAHQRIHTNERPFVCSICGKDYNQSGALAVHFRTHTNERNFVCDTCPKAFTNSSDLTKHKRTHQPHQFKCELCKNRTFAQKANYLHHLLNKHQQDINLEEDDCGSS